MKKLLLHVLLITCFDAFISARPCIINNDKKASGIIGISASEKNDTLLQSGSNETEIYPLNIFTLRYF